MNVAEVLELHAHRLGEFAQRILQDKDLEKRLRDPDTHSIVLVPSERGIEALDAASMHQHAHDPKDYVVCLDEPLDPIGTTIVSENNHELSFTKEGFETRCNSVLVKNDTVEGALQAPNGAVYVLDRPLQFYD